MHHPLRPSSNRRSRLDHRRAVVLALLAAGSLPQIHCPARAAEAEPEPEPGNAADSDAAAIEPSSLRNWVEFSLGATAVDGDVAAMRYRTGLPEGAYGMIKDLHFEADIDATTLLKIDGHAIYGNEDYGLSLEVNRTDLGYLRAGLSRFRRYYDATGGYFPPDQLAYDSLFDDALHVDRRQYWFEAGLRKPDWPEITLRYARFEREGMKGSTLWGDTTTTAGIRKIVPAFLELDEVRDLVALDFKKGLGRTTLGAGLRYDRTEVNNTKNLRFNPGGPGADSHATQREMTDTDVFSGHGTIENRFTDRLWLTAGYSYTDMDADTGGYRLYGTGYDPDFANRLSNTASFDNLQGTGRLSQHIANLNLYWNIADHLDLVPSVRMDAMDRSADSSYNQPALPGVPSSYAATSDRGLVDVAGALELRYRGVTNIVLFVRGDWLAGQGDLDESWNNVTTPTNVVSVVARSTDDQRYWQKYSAGANWYPHRRFSIGAGYYFKSRQNDFDHIQDSTPGPADHYPAFLLAQSYTVHDPYARVTWRPRMNLTLIGRYDYQIGEFKSQGAGLLDEETADVKSQIASASLSWVPLSRVYLQGSGSYARDRTQTATPPSVPIVAREARNDYWTLSASIGYALSNEVDLEGSYFHYRADNFDDDTVAGQPYGAGIQEHWASAKLTWRVNPRLRWIARYGYGTSDDDTSGGYNDYDVHIVEASMQYRF